MKAIFLLLSLFLALWAELSEDAHSAFIAGEYHSALKLYRELEQDSLHTNHAKEMQATIYEEYLGEIDSAIDLYSSILNNSSNSRLTKRIQKRIEYLNSLGSDKDAVGEYRRLLVKRTSIEEKIISYESFLKEHPNFIYQDEILRLLASLYVETEEFLKAEQTMNRRFDLGTVTDTVGTGRYTLYANRQRATYLYTIILSIWGILFVFFARNRWKQLFRSAKIPLIIWSGITLLFWSIYMLFIRRGLYNPFSWYSPLLVMLFNVPVIMWIVLWNIRPISKRSYWIVTGVPALLFFAMQFHLYLYFSENAMELMDTFKDRTEELIHGDIQMERIDG